MFGWGGTLCLNFRQPDKVFKIFHDRQSVFCWCRVNTDRKNRIILFYSVFLDHKDVAKYTLPFCNRSTVLGQDFQTTPCLAVPYVIQSVHNIRFIECYFVPDHQVVFKDILKFTMLISTTARQTSNCMQIIAYHIASFQTNHFQLKILRVRQSRIFLISSKCR